VTSSTPGTVTNTTSPLVTALGTGPAAAANLTVTAPTVAVAKAAPTIAATATPNQYAASYVVTVSNTGGAAGSYTLTDTPAFPATGVTLNSLNVSTSGGTLGVGTFPVANPANNTAQTISAAAVAIAPATSHTYTVVITFTTSAAATNLTCSGILPNNGAFNTATITGSTAANNSNCGTIPGAASVAVVKTAPTLTGTANPYSVSYSLTVTNNGSGTGTYTLTDTPGFAPGLVFVINGATVTTTGGTLNVGASPYTPVNGIPQQFSTAGLTIVAGATHTYTVTMQFNTSAGATNLSCVAGTPGNGLYNAANITGSSSGSSNTCTNAPGIADLTPTFTFGSTSYTVNQTREVIININEINNVTTVGTVQFFVPLPNGVAFFDYVFNPSLLSASTLAGNPAVDNVNWTAVDTGTGLLFTLNNDLVSGQSLTIPALGRRRLVIQTTAKDPGGKGAITVNIVALSGGETRTNNNVVVLLTSVQR